MSPENVQIIRSVYEAFNRGLYQVAAGDGVDAVYEALIGEILGEGAWDSFPVDVRRILSLDPPFDLAGAVSERLRRASDRLEPSRTGRAVIWWTDRGRRAASGPCRARFRAGGSGAGA